ncbi:MAG: energy transducer TonB [Candidatus Thermoplasmatota archaeon]|nr:energy transducer TonB [Candidatus Thermoplasmatota archaeon]
MPALKPDPGVEPARPASSMFQRSRISPASLIGVAFAHAGLLGLLVLAPDTPEPIAPPRPLMVSLIQPEAEEAQPQPEPAPKPQPPRPAVKPLPPPPVLVAKPTPAPAPQPVIEAPRPAPEPVPEVLPPPAPATEAPEPAPPSTPPRPAGYLNNPNPPYPALSRRLGEEGTVRLSILVNPDGSVARLELARSSGHPRLDRSAMETVQSSWKFEPARRGGRPVAAWVIVPIQFTLRS